MLMKYFFFQRPPLFIRAMSSIIMEPYLYSDQIYSLSFFLKSFLTKPLTSFSHISSWVLIYYFCCCILKMTRRYISPVPFASKLNVYHFVSLLPDRDYYFFDNHIAEYITQRQPLGGLLFLLPQLFSFENRDDTKSIHVNQGELLKTVVAELEQLLIHAKIPVSGTSIISIGTRITVAAIYFLHLSFTGL